MVLKQFRLNILTYFWKSSIESKEIAAVLLTVSKKKVEKQWHALNIYELIWFKPGMMLYTIEFYILILV